MVLCSEKTNKTKKQNKTHTYTQKKHPKHATKQDLEAHPDDLDLESSLQYVNTFPPDSKQILITKPILRDYELLSFFIDLFLLITEWKREG